MYGIPCPVLFSSGFDFRRLACPGDELDHHPPERQQGSEFTTRVPLSERREVREGSKRVSPDQLKRSWSLRVAIIQAENDLVHNRYRVAAFHPICLKGIFRQCRQDVAIQAAELGAMRDQYRRDLARRHTALQTKDSHPQFDQMIEPIVDAIAGTP